MDVCCQHILACSMRPQSLGSHPRMIPSLTTRRTPRERLPQRCMALGGKESSSKLTSLADTLLKNAASLLGSDRSSAYCVACKGTGYAVCSACEGSGILAPQKVAKMNSVKHAFNKLSTMMSGAESSSMHDSDWIKTNRCPRCKGSGRCQCEYCGGSGRRAT